MSQLSFFRTDTSTANLTSNEYGEIFLFTTVRKRAHTENHQRQGQTALFSILNLRSLRLSLKRLNLLSIEGRSRCKKMFGFVNKPVQLLTSPTATSPSSWSQDSTLVWLTAYFVCNLALTIYNKIVLAGDFPYPYTLTAVHCFFGTVGCLICLKRGLFTPVRLTRTETGIIVLFSGLYTINIIVSNVSLFPPQLG